MARSVYRGCVLFVVLLFESITPAVRISLVDHAGWADNLAYVNEFRRKTNMSVHLCNMVINLTEMLFLDSPHCIFDSDVVSASWVSDS